MKHGYTAEEKALVWLDSFEGLTYRRKAQMLSLCPSAEDLAAAVAAGGEKFADFLPPESRALLQKSLRDGNYLSSVLNELAEKGIFCVTLRSADYPAQLKETLAPPLVLYGKGDRSLLQGDMFAVVGSRRTQTRVQALTREFAAALSEHFTIVTGIAEGGDVSAVRGVLEKDKAARANVVCVLAHGFDYVYPAAHADILQEVCRRGLALTEHRPDVRPQKFLFPVRNRIIAGLARGVLVVSGGMRSGTSVTAGYALDYGRDVFAFPYDPGVPSGAGCNALIKNGACLADCVPDILSHYGLEEPKPAAPPPLSGEERKVLSVLSERGEAHIEELSRLSGLPAYLLSGVLSGLEVKGMVVRAGGNRYAAVGGFLPEGAERSPAPPEENEGGGVEK